MQLSSTWQPSPQKGNTETTCKCSIINLRTSEQEKKIKLPQHMFFDFAFTPISPHCPMHVTLTQRTQNSH